METITISAPMTGRVIEVSVSGGDALSCADTLMVVESMKMENEIISEQDGRWMSIEPRLTTRNLV